MIVADSASPAGTTMQRGAQVLRVPPPLYYGAAFAAGMLLRGASVPLAIGARPAVLPAGFVVFAAGVGLCAAAVSAVVRNQTTIVPHRPVSRLVTVGAYRISRNPMYSGLAIAYVGGALLVGSWRPLATLPIALVLIRQLVIVPEERYLGDHFGQTYLDYQAHVGRWFPKGPS